MNLRCAGEERAFPLRDDVPAMILTGNFTDEETYTHRCHAFFAAVFSCLRDHLSVLAGDGENVIKNWNDSMTQLGRDTCDQVRELFFMDVEEKYNDVSPYYPQSNV